MKEYFKVWKGKESYELTNQLAKRYARESGPYRAILEKAIDEKDYETLVNLDVDYACEWTPATLFSARQCLAFYSKCSDIDIGLNKADVALAKFIESEQACKESNMRIAKSRVLGSSPVVDAVIFMAQRKIARILGDVPLLEDLQLVFGPGANTNARKTTSARWKLSAKPACSANMASTVVSVLAEIPAYTSLHSTDSPCGEFWRTDVEIMPGELMFVPKNAKTDRAIIVEPSLNSLVQKGYGSYMKRLLYKSGINLYDQSINRRRARLGSIDNSLMTIDLSSASDTVSKELVSELLPLDWYIALSSVRTSHVEHKASGSSFHLHKFSSMGNGYTFELESLIFYALTWATCHFVGIKPDVSVYGDDIICPPEIYEELKEVFTFCGFSINEKKSFISGPFRESCGADFYNGVNVRPYYQKQFWSWGSLTSFHNFLIRSGWSVLDPEVLEYTLLDRPDRFRNYGPDGYGDGHLLGDFSPTHFRRDYGWSGYVFNTWVQGNKRVKGSVIGDFVLPCYTVYTRASMNSPVDPFIVRGSKGEKLISVYTLSRF